MIEISFIHHPLYLIPAGILAGIVVYILYFKSSIYSKPQRNLLAALRFTGLIILSILLLRPILSEKEEIQEKPILIWLDDASASVSNATDSVSYQAYREEKLHLLAELQSKYKIDHFQFSDKVYRDSLGFNGLSNLSRAIAELEDIYEGQDPSGLVISTDGILNRGSGISTIQIPKDWPTSFLKLGQSKEEPEAKIAALRFNREILLGRILELEFDLKATAWSEGKLGLRLYSPEGKLIAEQNFIPTSETWYESGTLSFKTEKLGLQNYKLELLDAQNQIIDYRSIQIEVKKEEIKVVIYSKESHPDIAAIARALSNDPLVSIDYCEQIEKLEALNPSLVISTELRQEFGEIMEASKFPCFFLLGSKDASESFIPGLSLERSEPEAQFADWSPDFNYFPLSQEQKQLWSEFPPLDGIYGPRSIPSTAKVMFYKRLDDFKTEEPLAYLDETEKGQRTAVILARGIWRWRIQNYRFEQNFEAFDNWLQDVLKYLLAQEKEEPLQLQWEKEIVEGLKTTLKAKLYDKSGYLYNSEELSLYLRSETNQTYTYQLSPYQNYYRLALSDLKAGNYEYSVSTGEEKDAIRKSGLLEVKPNDLEQRDLNARHKEMDALAQKIGAQSYSLNNREQLVKDLINRDAPKLIREHTIKSEILSRWPLFFVILSLFALEWFLRKYWGRY